VRNSKYNPTGITLTIPAITLTNQQVLKVNPKDDGKHKIENNACITSTNGI